MFSVIALVAWAIIGLPFFYSGRTNDNPAQSSTYSEANRNAQGGEPWLTKDAAGFFTFWLVLVGVAQLGLFAWQLWLIRQSLDDAKNLAKSAEVSAETAKVQAATAQLHAETAQATLQTMQDTARRQLRAYVLVSGAKVLNPADPTKRIFQLSIKNFGQTPAHDLKFWVGAGIKDYPLTEKLDTPSEDMKRAVDVLAPGRLSIMEVPVATTAWAELALANKAGAIYGHGQVTYLDAFNAERKTNFRMMCVSEQIAGGRVSPCEDGNSYT
jgi:hypothetical protein